MREVSNKRWVKIFIGVTVLVLLQIGWWTFAFMQDVSHIEMLTSENLSRRRFMFLSESVFFAALTCVGLYMLYRALKKEERSREIQRNFIEIVTHESKTPLTALKLRLESAFEKGEGKVQNDVGLALDEVRRLSSIFEKAMSLNRVEREVFAFETLDLSDLVRDVARRLEPFLKSKKVVLGLELASDTVVQGDLYGLQGLVQSLIENAVLYNAQPEKCVDISVRRENHSVLLTISDNGPGIPDSDRTQLFERFYRGKSNKSVPGTGLGLYIVKTIIEAHHGQVRLAPFDSRGARFEIELPLGAV